MSLKTAYLVLCGLGTLLPGWFFVAFLVDHGFDFVLIRDQLFANRISAFFGMDVVVSAVVLIVFIVAEGRAAGTKLLWLPVLGTLMVGVSLGLPLFLYLRQSCGGDPGRRAAEPRWRDAGG